MPEGHTIHRLARDHTRDLAGRTVAVSSPQGRFADRAATLDGRVLRGVEAYGKHLFYRWERDELVHVHLGLFGKFRRHTLPWPEPKATVRLRLATDELAVDLTGPTDCSLGTRVDRARLLERLGPDPLRADADPTLAIARWCRSKAPIGKLLLDQSVIAGVGNVFRAEALFVHGLHPERPGRSLGDDLAAALWVTIAAMLRQGVRDNRIVTVDPAEVGRPRSRITRADATYVYRQDTCRRCASPVRRWDLGGRWAYACPSCQPL